MGLAGCKRLRVRAARGLGVPVSRPWRVGCGLLEVTGPLGLGPTVRCAGADAHALPSQGWREHSCGPSVGCVCGPGAGKGLLPRGVFSSSHSDVIDSSGWEPGGGGGGGAGRPPQVHVLVMKRHLTVGQDAREGAQAGRTAAPPEPIAVVGLSMGEQEEGAVSATGPASAAPR